MFFNDSGRWRKHSPPPSKTKAIHRFLMILGGEALSLPHPLLKNMKIQQFLMILRVMEPLVLPHPPSKTVNIQEVSVILKGGGSTRPPHPLFEEYESQ